MTSNSPQTAVPPAAASNPVEQRVSIVTGDRLCTGCGYNLVGSPVLREGHYQLLIVRCPECAAVAAVQEYPSLGRWAPRLAMIFAGLWMLFLIVLMLGAAGMITGFCYGCGEESAGLLQNRIDADFDAANRAVDPSQGANTPQYWQQRQQAFSTWWPENRSAQIQKHGPWWRLIDPEMYYLWIPLGLLSALAGGVGAVAMVHLRLPGRLLAGLAVILIAMLFLLPGFLHYIDSSVSWSYEAARQYMTPRVMGMTLAFAALMLGLGLWLGRRVCRALIVALLPPRLRSPLIVLWETDGLALPRMRD